MQSLAKGIVDYWQTGPQPSIQFLNVIDGEKLDVHIENFPTEKLLHLHFKILVFFVSAICFIQFFLNLRDSVQVQQKK